MSFDPYVLELTSLNTDICEKSFAWSNQYSNVKSMYELTKIQSLLSLSAGPSQSQGGGSSKTNCKSRQ